MWLCPGKCQDQLPFHFEQDLPVGPKLTRFCPVLPPLKQRPRVLAILQTMILVDHLVPMEGVDHGIPPGETPTQTQSPFGKGPSCLGQKLTRFCPVQPPLKERPRVLGIAQSTVLVDHLVSIEGVDHGIPSG